jgi:hypothetical protein
LTASFSVLKRLFLMSSTSTRRSHRLQKQVSEMSWAVPQVIHERIGRMLLAGACPNEKDRAEFKLMSAEKLSAFYESWTALGQQTCLAQQEMAMAWVNTFTQMPVRHWPGTQLMNAARSATLGVLGAGLAPVHSRAVNNARRLSRVASS